MNVHNELFNGDTIMLYYRLAEHINKYMSVVQYIVSTLSTKVGIQLLTMSVATIKGVDPDTKVGGTAYMSTQREVLEGQTGSHRAKRANFGRGVRGSSPGKFQKPTRQMVQSTLFLSYICEYY